MDKTIKQLCNDLNLDKQTADDVRAEFGKVRDQFIIEGEQTHWLACAIYATTNKRNSTATDNVANTTNSRSTVASSSMAQQQQQQHQSNGVSLTQLLRLCKLSLVDFLSLMDKWLKMIESSADIRSKISHLERNFNVSAVVFKKYKEIFPYVFKSLSANSKQSPDKIANRIRNPRTNYELSTADIYYFCWVLYVNIKGTRPAISEDLVNSYHLLLTCIDFCYSNALVSKSAHNVLNPSFPGLPENFNTEDFKLMNEQPSCILKVLCDKWDGIAVDAKSFREHWLKPYLKDLVNRRVLQVSHASEQPPNMYLGVFDANNFESNMTRLTNEHDVTMLSIGDFDERIFLTENALKELGAPVYDLNDLKRMITERHTTPNNTSPTEDLTPPVDLDKQKPSLENGGRFVPQTPLSNRNYITSRIAQPSSPVANATRKVGDLYRMLAECTGEPTASLEDIFKLCTRNPRQSILDRTSRMVDKFVSSYTTDQDEAQAIELARKRADLARKLYFKVLESIIVREQKRLPTDKIGDSLSLLLSHEIFHISLFACCVEIVLASHNAKKSFPWVLDVYKDFGETHLYPFLFYKVIELVIREEERLSRDIVKHLATIEERVLDSMAWESDSPLWTAIAANGSIPSCQDVALPPTTNEQNPFDMSPLSSLRRHEGFQSPMPVSNRYGMGPLEGSARRRLFDGGLSGDASSLTTAQPQILQVVMPHRTENGDIRYVILNASAPDSEHVAPRHEFEQSPTPIRPAVKANPVNLFFRKVYYLAQLRFRDLWTRLVITGADIQQKIWTLFEDQIRNHTNLMRDRHLDQMIMCATYAIIKVSRPDRCTKTFFRDIMKAYRFQPQADDDVYMNVLLVRPQLKLLDDVGSMRTTPTLNTRSPTRRGTSITSPVRNGSGQSSAGSASNSDQSNLPERGSIIMFYNQVYLPQVNNLLRSFASQPDSSLKLSPLPRMNTHPISPWRRVSQQHSVYVSPLKCNSLPASPGRQLSYNFHRSPAKDLQTINSMINRQRAACKRILQDDDGENTKRPCISEVASKRINDIMNDRRASK